MRTRPALIPILLLTLATLGATGPATRPARPKPQPTDRPAIKLGSDGKPDHYFMQHHDSFLARDKAGPIGLLFLGDSITDFWPRAADVYQQHYGALDPADFGVSGDRTEHVLWRIANGELDGIHPKVVVLMIGTNNINDTPAHILAGDKAVVTAIHAKLPDAKLLLLGIFPRGADPANAGVAGMRRKITTVNAGLAKLGDGSRTRYLDISDKFLAADGTLPKDLMPDALHPSPKGYQVWADAMQPTLDAMLK